MKKLGVNIKSFFGVKRDLLDFESAPIFNRYPTNAPSRQVNSRMYLCKESKFLYFRIPKAANSFMLGNLLIHDKIHLLSLVEVDKLKEKNSTCHLLSDLELDIVLRSYFKFSIVRNPYSRFLSVFLDKVVREKKQIQKVMKRLQLLTNEKVSLDYFLSYLEMPGALMDDPHWARQSDLIPIPNERLDFVGRFENIEHDASFILKEIFGKSDLRVLANEHATQADSQVDSMLSADAKKRIYSLYSLDFERFEYRR